MARFDLNLLYSLDALLAERNVTKAAEKLCVTQSTMSGMLLRLRQQFNDELLVRRGKSFQLSPLAEHLSASIRATLLQVEATVSSKPEFEPSKDSRRFRIMASDYSTITLLNDLFRQCAKWAPRVQFEVLPIQSPLESIRAGEVDVCVTGNPAVHTIVHQDPTIRSDFLFSEVYCCVVDGEHPLRGPVSREDCARFPQIVVGFRGLVMATAEISSRPLTEEFPAEIIVPSFSVIPDLVAGTKYLGLIPKRLFGSTAARTNLRLLEFAHEGPSFNEMLIWHTRLADDPAFRWLRTLILGLATCNASSKFG
ncbi:LysR family transcriptional regulator [Bradyrhizobium jicamae]|uniref:LysR family transcriptional regulator n=1 Tax=Bradyrhizobium jicamae TaxID=280332 RepID=UPI001BA52095|nr:LysR family transcriptional regulator [Bradyrhizobium jicamae]MBR0755742.1 LysR family transcriptional regulator [Bradyrhizobium jicamae]